MHKEGGGGGGGGRGEGHLIKEYENTVLWCRELQGPPRYAVLIRFNPIPAGTGVDCTQSLSFLLVIERLARARCVTAHETGVSEVDGNYCGREKKGTACSPGTGWGSSPRTTFGEFRSDPGFVSSFTLLVAEMGCRTEITNSFRIPAPSSVDARPMVGISRVPVGQQSVNGS